VAKEQKLKTIELSVYSTVSSHLADDLRSGWKVVMMTSVDGHATGRVNYESSKGWLAVLLEREKE